MATHSPSSKVEPARFDSTCPRCNDEIVAGESIRYDREFEAWVHADPECEDWEEQRE